MGEGEAEETLRSLQRLGRRTAAKAQARPTPLFAWALAALGAIILCEVAHISSRRLTEATVQDGATLVVETFGSRSDARVALIVGLYWLVAGTIATIVSVRSYREQAVHPEPRRPASSTERLIIVLLIVFFAPGTIAALVSLGIFSGTWPFLVTSVWMIVLGRAIRNNVLERVALYSLLVVPLAGAVPDHGCAIAAGAYVATLGIAGEILRRKETAGA